jgi:hypothetical protein
MTFELITSLPLFFGEAPTDYCDEAIEIFYFGLSPPHLPHHHHIPQVHLALLEIISESLK